MFHFGLPGTCLYLSPTNTPFLRRKAGARKVYFPHCSKDIRLEVRNENVVKYDISLDILLVGSIYVTTY